MAGTGSLQLKALRGDGARCRHNCVGISAGDLGAAKIREHSAVEIRTERGRRLVARALAVGDSSGGVVYLDRHQLSALKPALDELVTVREIEFTEAQRVILEPLSALDENLAKIEQEIAGKLCAAGALVCAGMLLPVELASLPRPLLFRVVGVEPAAGQVTEGTRVILRSGRLMPGAAANLVTFADIGGLDAQIQQIRELVEMPLRFPEIFENLGIEMPRGVLLCGPPGSGKTYLAKALANEIGARFFYINGPEIVSSLHGGTEANLREIFKDAMEHRPAIVLIDEIDAIAPVRGESGLQADVRMGTQLLSLLDGLVNMEEVVVIGTTNRINSIDLALRRPGRFDKEIILPPMDDKGRLEVLHIHTRRVPLDDAASAFMPELAQRTHGYVGADLRELVREAGFTALRRVYGAGFAGLPTEPSGTAPLVTKADLLAALSRTAPSALRETLLQVADAHWSDIGGLKEEIRALRDAVEMPLRHSQAFAALRMKPSNGILLYGPSGTGKTMLAKAVANECGANFLPVSGPEIFSKWLGQSEAALRNLFQTARRVAPAVIFFDQLDALGARREDGAAHEIRPRIIGQLLAEMEGIQSASHVVVLAATNRKDLLDDALLEGGRFGQQIYVGLPDLAARRGILQLLLRDVPLAAGDDVSTLSEKVAARAGLVSGAALAALCEGAKRIALRETRYDNSTRLGLKHLLRAIDELHLGDNSPRSKVARSKTRAKPRRK